MVGFRRQIFFTKLFGDEISDGLKGLLGDVVGIGPHVGDESHRTLWQFHTLVELLGKEHGLLGTKAELYRALLL